MTFLTRLAADPKSLTARMRVGQVEPVALRRAVAALDMREGSEGTSTDPDVAELQQRIASLASEDALDGLSRRDLRAGCKAILQTRDVHVYLPMAVHPDPDLASSSFDLRLNALIERKRKLTRDLFFPPDASDGEIGELFREVSLESPIEPVETGNVEAAESREEATEPATDEVATPPAGDKDSLNRAESPLVATSDAVPSDAASGGERERQRLSLPKVAAEAQVRIWRRSAGEPRPTEEILALFSGRHLVQVSIRDPYALGTYEARRSQLQFLQDLQKAAAGLDNVLIEYAPEIEGDLEEFACRREFGSAFATEFAGALPKLVLARRSKRARDDDFHDRFIEVDVRHAGGAVKRHELTIGRGLEALYNSRRQCTVTYVPPGSH